MTNILPILPNILNFGAHLMILSSLSIVFSFCNQIVISSAPKTLVLPPAHVHCFLIFRDILISYYLKQILVIEKGTFNILLFVVIFHHPPFTVNLKVKK